MQDEEAVIKIHHLQQLEEDSNGFGVMGSKERTVNLLAVIYSWKYPIRRARISMPSWQPIES